MRKVHLISVGKLKEAAYLKVEEQYLKRISSFEVKIYEQKSHHDQTEQEALHVLKKIQEITKKNDCQVVLLTERGHSFNSHEFSSWLFKNLNKDLILVIGGAAGHGKQLYEIAKQEISLSPLTFPHHMVRALLAEQLYRAETIAQGHPYSK